MRPPEKGSIWKIGHKIQLGKECEPSYTMTRVCKKRASPVVAQMGTWVRSRTLWIPLYAKVNPCHVKVRKADNGPCWSLSQKRCIHASCPEGRKRSWNSSNSKNEFSSPKSRNSPCCRLQCLYKCRGQQWFVLWTRIWILCLAILVYLSASVIKR